MEVIYPHLLLMVVRIGVLLRCTLSKGWRLGIAICLVFSVATSTYAASPLFVPSTEATVSITPTRIKVGLPQRIVIPRIAVDARVEVLWLTEDWHMEVPSKYSTTGWLRTWSKPGNPGTAVIAGHFGWVRGKPTVFTELHQLRRGDTITVIDSRWFKVDFEVRKTQIYQADDGASEVFGITKWTSRLNLITCQGAWNPKTQSYPNRLVIFAVKKQRALSLKFP